MMERTYGRRKPGMLRTYSDSFNDTVSQSEYLSLSLSPDIEDPFDFSTQESTSLWNFSSRSNFFDDDDFSQKRAKRPRNGGEAFSEFGELMENEDEVNFALDGLKKGHHVKIRRAALSSLLSICASQHQRRSLRALGTSQSIIDAILGLSLDDTPSNLAAAILFFVLTADGQDEHFMESSNSIKFLIKLLRPVVSASTKGKPRNIGSRLLSVIEDVDAANMHDSSSCDILSRAQDILVNCKELRLIDSYKIEKMRPELSAKWVALLLMEKACLSKISFDDTSATVKKTGGMFKDKLRELGGLDAVFDVVMDCHAVIESWVAHDTLSVEDIQDDLNKQSLMLLLKCLKIMENATFLSTENQNHLLGFNKSIGSHGTRLSFTELMISVIKILSGLQLCAGRNEKHPHPRHVKGVNSESILAAKCKVKKEVVTISSDTWSITSCSSMRSASVSERNRSSFLLDCSVTSMSGYQSSVVSINDSCMLTTRAGSNTGSFAGRLASLGSGISRSNANKVRAPICKKVENSGSLEDSLDPYAFDLEDSGPSKRAAVSKKKSKDRKRKGSYRDNKDERSHQLFSSQEESNHCLNSQEESSDRDRHVTEQPSSTYDIDKGCLCLLSDCLLTAVKVLMNLTNENPVGCRKVAACRGLESMAELIAGHFPSFTKSPPLSKLEMPGSRHLKNKHLTDEELDFLVAILGLLVNLVEKDGTNRSRLAAASVLITDPDELEESEQDMIPLLCSIFLTNQASSDTTEETSTFTLDDEKAVLESEKEAEKMIVEAYSALLLAFLSTQSRSIRNAIRDYLPKRNLAILVPVLDRFVAFHTTLDMIPPETHKAVMKVIESCKLP